MELSEQSHFSAQHRWDTETDGVEQCHRKWVTVHQAFLQESKLHC